MLIGVPKEIKVLEYRVGLTPESVQECVTHGHQVLIETKAGRGISASDDDYRAAGAEIAGTAQEVYDRAEMIVKVKDPESQERRMLREGQVLFAFLHLAPDPHQAYELMASGATCIAYEMVTDGHGGLPLLAPMSKVAGRLSIQAGAHSLEIARGGSGILLGGVPGVAPAKVTIIGGGSVGENAAQVAFGMGADVTVIDSDTSVLDRLSARYGPALRTVFSIHSEIAARVIEADMVIGAVLRPGASAPKLVTRDMIAAMRPGSVVVDVAIDQGGCFETSRPTTHAEPTFLVDGVIHYCVSNMPGAVPRTSTFALNNATLPFVLAVADKGAAQALADDPHLRDGLNVHKGHITAPVVAEGLGQPYQDPAGWF